ncbi:transcription factor RfeG [Diaporthe helianthi]|uniref:Transcription factor RfeG n=1 Tax=Diaporthe helianthi TaxID=158607 RepID=A0A2P5I4I3_DIAHE|nr:transcription factor RfeG [Diaporthe helianthi]
MTMLPQTCQRPPSPPDSDKASPETTDASVSLVAKIAKSGLIRQNDYFIPREGIDSEVLAAELPLYLGNDVSLRRGTYKDEETGLLIQGYYISAYRNLTSAMLDDIKADSADWEQEKARYHADCTTGAKIQQWPDTITPPGRPLNEN